MIKRLGIVLLIPLLIIAYAIYIIIATGWAIIGFIPAAIWWIITGTYHDPMCIMEWGADH